MARTTEQQRIIDIINGWSGALEKARVSRAVRAQAAFELHGAASYLESHWPTTTIRLLHPVEAPLNENNPFGAVDDIYTNLGLLGHPGIDFLCPTGTPVLACHDGLVERADWAGTAGIMVALIHEEDNYRTRYLHLESALVRVGDKVTMGEFIGRSGTSGLSTGPHLHLDYYPAGEPQNNGYGGRADPTPFLING